MSIITGISIYPLIKTSWPCPITCKKTYGVGPLGGLFLGAGSFRP